MTARYLVIRALIRQEEHGYADLVLDSELKKCRPPLSGQDTAFATAVFYSVVEHVPLLDFVLSKFCRRPLAKLDAPVLAILRAGLAQGLYMAVPHAVAVHESVDLTRAFGKSSAAGMVNAILRRSLAAPAPKPADFPDPLERLQIYYCFSLPVAQLLWKQYKDEAFLIAEAYQKQRPTAIRVNTLRTDAQTLALCLQQEGHRVLGQGRVENSLLIRLHGSPAASDAFQKGYYHVQDLASQYAALCLDAKPGLRVLDLCAAPGGKALLLAQQMDNRGILLANDRSQHRTRLMRQAFERMGITCAQFTCEDGATWRPGVFDRVLCDVPCSGLGVIGKKPDIRYKNLSDLPLLLTQQQAILQNAAQALAEGGRLVYATCTLNQQENQEQIDKFLQTHPLFHVVTPKKHFPGTYNTGFGSLFLPQNTETDGFFVAILEKT